MKPFRTRRFNPLSLARESKSAMIDVSKKDPRPHYMVACATLSLIVSILLFVLGVITVAMIDDIEEQTAMSVRQLQEQQFNEIWGLMVATHHAAYLQSQVVRDRILRAIERNYHTPEHMESLHNELSYPREDSPITQIFMTAIEGMYMFHNTDFNGMSVIVTYNPFASDVSPRGYLAATHNNNFIQAFMTPSDRGDIWLLRDIAQHAHNPALTEQQLSHIMSNTGTVDVIPFTQINYPASQHEIQTMDRYAVHEAFLAEGMAVFLWSGAFRFCKPV